MGIPNIPKLDFTSVAGLSMGGGGKGGGGAELNSLFKSMNTGGSGMPSFGLPGLAMPNMGMFASLSLPSDTLGLMTTINTMMAPTSSLINDLLAGIANGSISSKAPEGQQTGADGTQLASNASAGSQATGPAAPGTDAALRHASSMIGLNENSDRAELNKLTKTTGLDVGANHWCAAFALSILKQHGVLDLSGLSNPNYTPTIYNWAKANGIWGDKDSYVPKPGDAAEIDWEGGGVGEDIDHIGIVEKVETDANGKVISITLLEGNSSDSVKRNTYTGERLNVISGYVISGKSHPGKRV